MLAIPSIQYNWVHFAILNYYTLHFTIIHYYTKLVYCKLEQGAIHGESPYSAMSAVVTIVTIRLC